jgi:hypothetical protein
LDSHGGNIAELPEARRHSWVRHVADHLLERAVMLRVAILRWIPATSARSGPRASGLVEVHLAELLDHPRLPAGPLTTKSIIAAEVQRLKTRPATTQAPAPQPSPRPAPSPRCSSTSMAAWSTCSLAFKAKFQPEYRPCVMTYPDPAALPAIGNAIGRAYLPEMTSGQMARLGGRLLATAGPPSALVPA